MYIDLAVSAMLPAVVAESSTASSIVPFFSNGEEGRGEDDSEDEGEKEDRREEEGTEEDNKPEETSGNGEAGQKEDEGGNPGGKAGQVG